MHPPPPKNKPFPRRGSTSSDLYITLNLYISEMPIFVRKAMKKYTDMSGLTMKNGRLINERPCGMTGIQHAAEMKKMLKREQKIEMMVEADVRASMREKMLGYES